MNDTKTNKGLLWLALITSLLFLVLSNALSWLDDSDYSKLLIIVPYKWQLTILMSVIISLLFAYVYTRIFFDNGLINSKPETKINSISKSKDETKDSEKTHEQIMQNLSGGEKSILLEYLRASDISREFKPSGTIDGMVRNGILFTPYSRVSGYPVTYNLEPWAWEYLNKHKKELFINL